MYGCPFHSTRGTCTNTRTVARVTLEKELLAKVQSDVLSDAAIDYVLDRVGHEIRKRFAALDGEMDSMRRRKAKLESELRNLGQAFATGFDSPTLRAEIAKREAELSSITQKTLGRNKDSVHAQVSGLRKFVEHNLRHVRRLISGKYGNPIVVRQELAKHIESIKLFPEGKGQEIRYKGSWRILGRRLQGVCRGRESLPIALNGIRWAVRWRTRKSRAKKRKTADAVARVSDAAASFWGTRLSI